MAIDHRRLSDLSERETQALERAREKARLVAWLRAEAASRDGEMAWYVARTNWRADSVAAELRAEGIEAVCPMARHWKRFPRGQRKYPVEIPLFGNWLFVRLLKAESAWVGVLSFDGVAALAGDGEKPVPITAREEVQLLIALASATEAPASRQAGLRVGDDVVHPLGSFAELIGKVVSIDEAKRQALVSTVLFGREVATSCGIDDLTKL